MYINNYSYATSNHWMQNRKKEILKADNYCISEVKAVLVLQMATKYLNFNIHITVRAWKVRSWIIFSIWIIQNYMVTYSKFHRINHKKSKATKLNSHWKMKSQLKMLLKKVNPSPTHPTPQPTKKKTPKSSLW